MSIRFILNRTLVETDLAPGITVLDYLRTGAGLKGTKEGCREGDCGACTVLIGTPDGSGVSYRPATSCLLALASIAGRHLVTIEGLDQEQLTPVQQAIIDEGASQCGFCTPGIVLALTGHLLAGTDLGEVEATAAVAGNICRCTGYLAIRRAISSICERIAGSIGGAGDRAAALIRAQVVPPWFSDIPARLAAIGAPPGDRAPRPGQTILGGGTDLYVQRPRDLAEADLFLAAGSPELAEIRRDGDDLLIGAAASTEAIRTSPLVQELLGVETVAQLLLISSPPIRHLATVGGNLVNASPIGDLAIILLALDASVELRRSDSCRNLPLRDFFKGYKLLDLGDGEIIERLRIPGRLHGALCCFEKVSKRTYLDIASVNTALTLRLVDGTIAEAHLSAGGVAPVPLYLRRASAALTGRPADAEAMLQAAAVAGDEISPISDVRGSAEYKRLLLRQLILAHGNRLLGLDLGGNRSWQ